jgi:sugar/nucleoside kinase (ribokinase family)
MSTQHKKIAVSGLGCCLVDHLYNNVNFSSKTFSHYLSKQRGDGGLTPGQLVFREEFERFIDRDYSFVLKEITCGRQSETINIGGPGIVPLIHAAQLLGSSACIKFYGCQGRDEDGNYIHGSLKNTPIEFDICMLYNENTPSTVVLSDPSYDDGHGERIFINTIGAAGYYSSSDVEKDFYDSDVVVFGGTALLPNIHDNLTELLQTAKSRGCITVVNTVFDFRNEKENPNKRWPLGKSDESYKNIDLLIMDNEEAFRLSGKVEEYDAMQFFRELGSGAVIITNGSKNIHAFSNGGLFSKQFDIELPISEAITEELRVGQIGDTTGCGDNFAGGILASLVSQLQYKSTNLDLMAACSLGVVSGGFACFYMGGTYIEASAGEKWEKIKPYYEKYKIQVGLEKQF